MKNKKSQVEIMGLLIIVILVVIILFVVIVFTTQKKSRTITKTYGNDQISNAFLLALLDTTSECDGQISLRDVIYDCAIDQLISCPSSDRTSCMYINESLRTILDSTLNLWGKEYIFEINHPVFVQYNNFTFINNCVNSSIIYREAPQFIPVYPRRDDIKVSIKVCS